MAEYFPATDAGDFRGGAEARAFYLARHLSERHEVTVLATREPGQPAEAIVAGARVLRAGRTQPYDQAGRFRARLTFLAEASAVGATLGPEIVDAQAFLAYLPAWRIARATGARAVATVHDSWPGRWMRHVGALTGLAGEATERLSLGLPWQRFIAVSEATARTLERRRPGATITVVPNGVPLEALPHIAAGRPDRPTVCYVGRLVRYKRVDLLLHAAAALRAEQPGLRLVVVGSGPERSPLERLGRALGLDIEFRGHVRSHAEVLRAVRASHVFCSPSTVEGFGIAVLEAMALGVPYVAADIPAVREATQGLGGCLVTPGDLGDLTRGLREMLASPPREDTSAWTARFDWPVIARAVEAVYAGLLGERAAAPPVRAGTA